MGLLSLFGKGPLSDKKIDRVAKLAANPFAQPDVRMREMQRLLEDGSSSALRGLLKRFAANAQGHIADEEEKTWLEDALVERGDDALAALRDYIGTEDKLTYALRAYRRIAGEAEAVSFFLDVLCRYGPDDYRSLEAKLQLAWQLSESLEDERVLPGLIPFLQDHGDDVRWAVLDVVERACAGAPLPATVLESIQTELSHLLTDEEVSGRIAQRAAAIASNHEWTVRQDEAPLASGLQDAYFIDKKRYLRRKKRSG